MPSRIVWRASLPSSRAVSAAVWKPWRKVLSICCATALRAAVLAAARAESRMRSSLTDSRLRASASRSPRLRAFLRRRAPCRCSSRRSSATSCTRAARRAAAPDEVAALSTRFSILEMRRVSAFARCSRPTRASVSASCRALKSSASFTRSAWRSIEPISACSSTASNSRRSALSTLAARSCSLPSSVSFLNSLDTSSASARCLSLDSSTLKRSSWRSIRSSSDSPLLSTRSLARRTVSLISASWSCCSIDLISLPSVAKASRVSLAASRSAALTRRLFLRAASMAPSVRSFCSLSTRRSERCAAPAVRSARRRACDATPRLRPRGTAYLRVWSSSRCPLLRTRRPVFSLPATTTSCVRVDSRTSVCAMSCSASLSLSPPSSSSSSSDTSVIASGLVVGGVGRDT
mmetsp:Transcript_26979/g.62142  ORF Transcript_26979/g.62142 Transcript_26979/m.62142 type:complete len:405 (+) Transcript_26979:529-1743(+)